MEKYIKEYGFSLIRTRMLDELDATLYQLSHEATGLELIYLNRADENKTFAIAFPTPPENDTGVFHIIEHSVLCGSQKYPLRDPFAELLKSSLNTFLNAVTYEDRTVYPVSSRCEKDFLNLVDVYLDAVFKPNMLVNPHIFEQEGWHYEYDRENDRLSYNGVVYNEMKGAYSSPDEIGGMALYGSLFSDSIYSRDSGGNPEVIPSLTFDQLKATHEKHYHPSGAKIILDGQMDLEKVLPLICSHLSGYEKRSPIVVDSASAKKTVPVKSVSFEISQKENPKGKARILFGYVVSDFSDRISQIAAGIFADFLCGSNASPLKKALLDRGLCKDAAIYLSRSRHQTLTLEIRDTDPERYDEIYAVVNEVITGLVENGIDRGRLISVLNNMEFKLRERDFGSLPSGIAFAMTMFGSWIYGARPEDALLVNDVIADLREKMNSDYYETALANMMLKNEHTASVIMVPDPNLGEINARKHDEELGRLRRSFTEEELCEIERREQALREWQQTEETEDKLASLPKLEISDVPTKTSLPSVEESEVDGVKIIVPQVKTNGIVYISAFFSAADASDDELFDLSMLASSLLNFKTKSRDTLQLQTDIKSNLGSFFSSVEISTRDGVATPYLRLAASALESKLDDLIEITEDVLLGSVIDNPLEIRNLLSQAKSQIEDAILTSGESVALSRIEAGISEGGAITEYLTGYEAYRIICRTVEDDSAVSALTERISALLKRIVTKNRLMLSVSKDCNTEFINRFISIFPEDDCEINPVRTGVCAGKDEFFLIPSKVAYAVIGGGAPEIKDKLGFFRVARSILSYEYLWNTIRVKNGAYGTGFVPRRDGSLAFYSYRDPSPENSIEYYKGCSEYLRTLADEDCDITKFIIGAIGEYDTLMTPRTASLIATRGYLSGWGAEDEQAVLSSMLSMKAEDLNTVADIIDSALSDMHRIVVGGREHLDSLSEKPKVIIEI